MPKIITVGSNVVTTTSGGTTYALSVPSTGTAFTQLADSVGPATLSNTSLIMRFTFNESNLPGITESKVALFQVVLEYGILGIPSNPIWLIMKAGGDIVSGGAFFKGYTSGSSGSSSRGTLIDIGSVRVTADLYNADFSGNYTFILSLSGGSSSGYYCTVGGTNTDITTLVGNFYIARVYARVLDS
jgi:hypothetical protein